MPCECRDRAEILGLVQGYARCLDARDWTGLEAIFLPDATATYGGYDTVGRPQIISSIRRHLDSCGPSQHLLGYHVASLDGDGGSCETQARVLHLPADPTSELRPYEAVGSYRDELTHTDDGWLIKHRTFEVRIEIGDRQVLLPAR